MIGKLTIAELLAGKGKCQRTEVFVHTPEEAAACEEAGIDLIVALPGRAAEIRAAAPNTFLVLPVLPAEGSPSHADAIRTGMARMELGADAIYCGSGFDRVRAMAGEYIPVIGHVGLVPYRSSWTGGFKAVGKTADTALHVYEQTLAYEDAGAIGVEMEIVPRRVATEISRRTRILVISMGSGSGGDAQYLFAEDILGTNRGHVPRHAKVYRNLATELDRVQRERVAAFTEFQREVQEGTYPGPEHQLDLPDDEFTHFLSSLLTESWEGKVERQNHGV